MKTVNHNSLDGSELHTKLIDDNGDVKVTGTTTGATVNGIVTATGGFDGNMNTGTASKFGMNLSTEYSTNTADAGGGVYEILIPANKRYTVKGTTAIYTGNSYHLIDKSIGLSNGLTVINAHLSITSDAEDRYEAMHINDSFSHDDTNDMYCGLKFTSDSSQASSGYYQSSSHAGMIGSFYALYAKTAIIGDEEYNGLFFAHQGAVDGSTEREYILSLEFENIQPHGA